MPTIDEKKVTIISLLKALKEINPQIGNYEKSILNDHAQFAVKLSNGRLTIPQETVNDYEQSPQFITKDQLEHAASTYIPAQVTNSYVETKNEKASPKLQESNTTIPLVHSNDTKQRSSTLKRILILSVIVVVGLIGYFVYGQISKAEQATQIEDGKRRVRDNITDYVTVGHDDYKYSTMGGIYGLVIKLRNSSDYMMENVRVTVTYIKSNGEVWTNRDFDFEMLSANSEGTIKVPDTNRGVSVKVRITGIKSIALGLN